MKRERSNLEPSLVLALDQGGGSTRAYAVDPDGEALASASIRVSEGRPNGDRVEQDPEELARSLREAVEGCLDALEPGEEIARAGLATQRASVVCWDRESGAALSPVLSWQDRRARERVEALAVRGEEIRRRTGLRLSPHYGASKLAWCLENLPEVRRAREGGRLVLGPLASFLAFRLLEERPLVADPANASRTQLWSLASRDWDPGLCDLFGVPLEALPRSVPTRGPFGTIALRGRRIPLEVLTGDQSAAVFAWGLPRADTAYANFGTGAFVQRPVRGAIPDLPKLLASVVYSDERGAAQVVEGTVNGAASALGWAGRELGIADLERKLPRWLREVADPPLFLNGVSGLGAPFWAPGFRPRFVGEGGAPAKAVAVLESVVFLTAAILEEMATAVPRPARIVASGGLSEQDGLCSRLASLAGAPVERTEEAEATASGLAWLVARRTDPWPVLDPPRTFAPDPDVALEARYGRWREELDRALAAEA